MSLRQHFNVTAYTNSRLISVQFDSAALIRTEPVQYILKQLSHALNSIFNSHCCIWPPSKVTFILKLTQVPGYGVNIVDVLSSISVSAKILCQISFHSSPIFVLRYLFKLIYSL